VAHAASAASFGAFSLVYLTAQTVLVVVRAATSLALLVTTDANAPERRNWINQSLSASALAGMLFGIGFAAAGLLLSDESRIACFVMAAAMPVWLLQDAIAYVAIYLGRPGQALVTNVIWLGFQAMFMVSGWIFFSSRPWVAQVAWVCGVVCAAAYGVLWLSPRLSVAAGSAWLNSRFRAIVDLVGDNFLQQVGQQSLSYILGVGVGLAGVAAYRATQVPFGLLRTVTQGIVPVSIVDGKRWVSTRGPASIYRFVFMWAICAGIGAAVLGALLLCVPDHYGASILGAAWSGARGIVPLVTISMVGVNVNLAALVGLRILGATRATLLLRFPNISLQLVGAGVGAFGGLHWALGGYLIGVWLCVPISAYFLRGAVVAAKSDNAGASAVAASGHSA